MYRRLEPKPSKMKVEENSKEGVCFCSCKTVQSKNGPPQPEANQTVTQLAVYYDVNG